MKKHFLALLLGFWSLTIFAQLTLRVTAFPTNTPSSDTIFVAGSFNNWAPKNVDYALKKQNDGSWSLTLTLAPGTYQYKFTRGSWQTVEGNATGGFTPNRSLTYSGGAQTADHQILSWEGQGANSTAASNVRVISTSFSVPQLNRTRRIWVYLPPNYTTDSTKRFPVMYMHDGQNVFDAATAFAGEWKVDETLNALFQQGDKGCIVVAIDNGGGSRINEYSPWRNATYGGGEGARYANFIVETLKPYVDANFRTKADRLNTAIGGSSMGGLISMYAALQHQNVFSKAAIFSPSLWFSDSVFVHAQQRGRQQPMRFYFVAGQNESAGMVPDINRMTGILKNAGFTDDEVRTVAKSDGQHAEWFWAREFGDAYKWLFRELTSSVAERMMVNVRLFPNPTDSVLNVETSENVGFVNVAIYDVAGRLMDYRPLRKQGVDVHFLQKGTYILRGTVGNRVVFSEKFVKN